MAAGGQANNNNLKNRTFQQVLCWMREAAIQNEGLKSLKGDSQRLHSSLCTHMPMAVILSKARSPNGPELPCTPLFTCRRGGQWVRVEMHDGLQLACLIRLRLM